MTNSSVIQNLKCNYSCRKIASGNTALIIFKLYLHGVPLLYIVFECHVYFVKDMPKKKLELSTEIAHLPENKTKNRYRDILPCKWNVKI
jgi:hypothetical protein